jgi:ketosteroid isomerase-like protein
VNTTNPPAVTDPTFDDFVHRCHDALAQQTKGNSEPYLALWSHTDDATVMAAVGGYQVGFENVSNVLRAASQSQHFDTWAAETLATGIEGDFAYTVEIERYTRQADGATQELAVRATQIYRRSGGDWRVLHRHGDVLSPVSVKW